MKLGQLCRNGRETILPFEWNLGTAWFFWLTEISYWFDSEHHSEQENLEGETVLSQYTREAYVHKERKGHPQIAWKLQ